MGGFESVERQACSKDARESRQARADVRLFLRDARVLEIWSARYFRDLADRLVLA